MKILLVHDYGVLAGGSERITADLREGLRARGHEVRLFASTARPIPLPNDADDLCFGTAGWPKRVLQIHNPFASRALRRVLMAFAPDVVHVRMFLTQLSPSILPLLRGVPALLHLGGYHTVCPTNSRVLPDGSACAWRAGPACRAQGCVSIPGLMRTLLQFGAWRRWRHVFRHVVANSDALARTLRENGVDVHEVIRNGTAPCDARPPLAEPPEVAFAGRLERRKGVDDLLRAVAEVVPHVPRVRVRIYGDGTDRGHIAVRIAQLGLRDHVTMEGHVARPELDRRLGSAWVQVVPSTYPEPFANVTLEAMMRGTAVIATDTGGSPEVVRDGETGYLVRAGDATAIAERLGRLLGDRDRAEAFGAAARAHALAELTTARMIDRCEAAYARIRAR